MKAILSVVVAAMALSVSAAVDYYVAVGGDDANDGLSPATAKATIAAAYTAMTNGTPEATAGNRLIIGDGEFELPSFTIVLTNNQEVVAENAGGAILKLNSSLTEAQAVETYSNGVFALNSDAAALKGVTVDFDKVKLKINGALMQNPKGTVSDCAFINYKNPVYNGMYGCNLVLIDDAAAAPVFRRCRFAGGKMPHIGSIIYVNAAASPIFDSCIFSDFANPNGGAHTVGVIAVNNKDSATVIRNCLFVRCEVAWNNANAVVAQLIYTYRTAANKTLVENCSIVDCRVLGWENAKKKQEETGNSKYSVAMITGDTTVRNTLVYGVRSSDGAEFADGAETCVNYSNSASDMTLVGTGNVQLEAGALVFAAPEEDDYTVLAGATVDGGAILDWMGAGAVDLRGEARVTGVKPDIGCFERKSEAKTYYVEKNGNDNNDGLSPETAKATIAGAYDAMTASAPQTEYADSIVVGDGVFELTGKTMKFSRRQKMSSVNGSGKTTLLVPSYIIEGTEEDRTNAAYQLFDLASPNVEFKGFTVDFNNRLFSFVSGAFSVNPAGKILDCVFENCKSGRVKSVFFIQITAGVSPVFSNCVFRNIHTHYRSSVVYVNSAAAHPVFSHCKFQDLTCAQYFTYGTFHTAAGSATLRNCLFLRCQNYQDMHKDIYRSATIHGNATTYIENCSIIDCSFKGVAYESEDGQAWVDLSGPIIKTSSVMNTLVYGCTNHLGGAVSCRETSAYSYCAHDAKFDAENNILLSPGSLRFRKPFKGDYTVVSGPTIDAAVELDWMTAAKDLLGRDRVIGGAPDIGCYEFDPKELLGMQIIFR